MSTSSNNPGSRVSKSKAVVKNQEWEAWKDYLKSQHKKGEPVSAWTIEGRLLEVLQKVDDRVAEGDTLFYKPEKDEFNYSHVPVDL